MGLFKKPTAREKERLKKLFGKGSIKSSIISASGRTNQSVSLYGTLKKIKRKVKPKKKSKRR